MKNSSLLSFSLAAICLCFAACGNQNTGSAAVDSTKNAMTDTTKKSPDVKTDTASYTFNGKRCRGFIAYDQNISGKRPVVVIIPEWWGLGEYVQHRARQLAELGYFAFAADLFGEGKVANNPTEAMAETKPFYMDPTLAKSTLEAAISKSASFPEADTSRVAAIGYCFGGFIALNAAKLGVPLKAVVSFHGGLGGVQPKKGQTVADILVCQGGADPFVPMAEQVAFKKSMDSVGAHYTFISYPGALHAFSNPQATELGKKFNLPIAYNAAADTSSWKSMDSLFATALK